MRENLTSSSYGEGLETGREHPAPRQSLTRQVNHHEEKDTLGVGQAQLWIETAVPKQPVLVVAAYSALLLASLIALGPQRGVAYAALPKWRRNLKRPSCLDLITLLRKEMPEKPRLLAPVGLTPSFRSFTAAVAAWENVQTPGVSLQG